MDKNYLISHVAAELSATRNIAERTVTTGLSAVGDTLARDEPVSIAGFGKFAICSCKARRGLNPETDQLVSIEASRMPSLKAAAYISMSAFPTRLETQFVAPGNSHARVL